MEALVNSFENDHVGGSLNVLHMPSSMFHNGHNSVRLSFFDRSIHPHAKHRK